MRPAIIAAAIVIATASMTPATVAACQFRSSYPIYFDAGQTTWPDTPDSRSLIASAIQYSTTPERIYPLIVSGHSDRTGTSEQREEWSRLRALSVSDELVRRGFPANAIQIEWLADQQTVTGRGEGTSDPLSRRVQLWPTRPRPEGIVTPSCQILPDETQTSTP